MENGGKGDFVRAIILAGGKGTRLRPYTDHRPKGLLQLSHYPLLEVIIRRLRAAGFDHLTLCVSHLADQIEAEFGDGGTLGVRIDYCMDSQPLGTAAPLTHVENWDAPAIVMNGDVLTTLDFADLYRAHESSGSTLTVASHRNPTPIGFGVLEIRDGWVAGIWEKPTLQLDIASGVYVVDPVVREALTPGEPADMPDLVVSMIERGHCVNAYSFTDRWHDIGTPESYEEAKRSFAENPDIYLRNVGRSDQTELKRPSCEFRIQSLYVHPLTVSGKENGTMTNDYPATSDLPSAIAQEMGTILECRTLGPEDDFFLFGGDSLRAVELIERLTELFEPKDAAAADRLHAALLAAVFEDASPAGLAETVQSQWLEGRSGR